MGRHSVSGQPQSRRYLFLRAPEVASLGCDIRIVADAFIFADAPVVATLHRRLWR